MMRTITINEPKIYNLDDADLLVFSLAWTHNSKIEAIKYLRLRYDHDLRTSKDIVCVWWDEQAQMNKPKHWHTKYLCESDANQRSQEYPGDLLRNKLRENGQQENLR